MLKKGDKLPKLKLQDEQGTWRELQSLAPNKPIVIFFYPKDNTSVCTAQACGFRDHYKEFQDAGAEVIGISKDSVASHQKVVSKRELPYTLLSDPERKALNAFKVPSALFGMVPARVTFVADQKGEIAHTFRSDFKADKHISEALKIVRKLAEK